MSAYERMQSNKDRTAHNSETYGAQTMAAVGACRDIAAGFGRPPTHARQSRDARRGSSSNTERTRQGYAAANGRSAIRTSEVKLRLDVEFAHAGQSESPARI